MQDAPAKVTGWRFGASDDRWLRTAVVSRFDFKQPRLSLQSVSEAIHQRQQKSGMFRAFAPRMTANTSRDLAGESFSREV